MLTLLAPDSRCRFISRSTSAARCRLFSQKASRSTAAPREVGMGGFYIESATVRDVSCRLCVYFVLEAW